MRIKKTDLLPIVNDLKEEELAGLIDHTKLKPHEPKTKMLALYDEAVRHNFASVCVNSCWAKTIKNYRKLNPSNVKLCCVVGFPLGQMSTEAKAFEASYVRKYGADEVDMVINIGKVREISSFSGRERGLARNYVLKDVREVVKASENAIVKVILETGYLLDEEIVEACKICEEAGADFVKTSTGFGPMGAYPHHLKLMRGVVGDRLGVKVAGGIRNFLDAIRSLYAAANTKELRTPSKFRIGTSAGINIVNTLGWAKYTDVWFVEEIPCKICPSNYTSKLPIKIRNHYTKKCRTCAEKEYRKFRDF
ncbi:MAG: deoxyribose-phosphate aldolase [Candidatus Bathyarchaeota archaeon]|nr:MAG: deoxyribose-phosphate aldolase [Candidatus Bathyarchaeota archaeon]